LILNNIAIFRAEQNESVLQNILSVHKSYCSQ